MAGQNRRVGTWHAPREDPRVDRGVLLHQDAWVDARVPGDHESWVDPRPVRAAQGVWGIRDHQGRTSGPLRNPRRTQGTVPLGSPRPVSRVSRVERAEPDTQARRADQGRDQKDQGPPPTLDLSPLCVPHGRVPLPCESWAPSGGGTRSPPMNWTIGPPSVLDAIRKTRGGTASSGFSRFDPGPDLDGSGPMLYQTVG